MFEKTLEAQLATVLQTAIDTAVTALVDSEGLAVACPVVGIWQPAPEGTAKLQYRNNVLLSTSIRANENFTSRICTVAVRISVKTSIEYDHACSILPVVVNAVVDILHGYNTSPSSMASALTVTSAFSAAALMFNAGAEPSYDNALGVWFVDIPIQIKGVITSP